MNLNQILRMLWPALGRFRVNVFRQRGSIGMVFRRVIPGIASFEELGLPVIARKLAEEQQGLIVVSGPGGSGKTTTLSCDDRSYKQNYCLDIL
jgi:twitching motility protein PilT